MTDFDEAVKLDPKYALAYNNRGYAHFMQKNYDRAIGDYDQAIRLDPLPAVAGVGGGGKLARQHLRQPRRRLCAQGRFRPCALGLLRGDPHRSELCARLRQPRPRVPPHRQLCAGDLRLQRGAAARSERHRASMPTAGSSHFLTADYPQATADLAQALVRTPEPYPLLWRYLARARAGGDGTAELAAAAGAAQRARHGRIRSSNSISGSARRMTWRPRRTGAEERCEAEFYSANGASCAAIAPRPRRRWKRRRRRARQSFYEYDGAVAELGRIER